MARDRIGATTKGWQRLTVSLAANATDVPHLDAHRARLTDLLAQVQTLGNQQAALAASKQEVTKQFQAALAEAHTVAAFLRSGLREKYGKEAEKLVEFGLRPFRGIRRKKEPDAPGPTPEHPVVKADAGTSDPPA